jgi:hypothetical protein
MAINGESPIRRVGPYRDGLGRNKANYASLSPLSFLPKAAAVHPDRVAIVHGTCRNLYPLQAPGIGPREARRWRG